MYACNITQQKGIGNVVSYWNVPKCGSDHALIHTEPHNMQYCWEHKFSPDSNWRKSHYMHSCLTSCYLVVWLSFIQILLLLYQIMCRRFTRKTQQLKSLLTWSYQHYHHFLSGISHWSLTTYLFRGCKDWELGILPGNLSYYSQEAHYYCSWLSSAQWDLHHEQFVLEHEDEVCDVCKVVATDRTIQY